ncbi:P-loop containing nucleoside triphosphate hydrolase protein [Rhizophagus irregularis]|uniref:P-loop containing nucleoside triphosphate hydrolase protein n=4 Tax=Rhizophagus irregularis TaxID=588596 RepID=A0A2N0PLX0_9GLOM|nr:putative ABC transporter [Rhizophagus irregularis DAOM 181602=DAOM 197198]PKC07846.1 P-loop containing nucleoside triphosphate hydrolase protein [Rhizophagus irregularis]POG64299.1 putative ABC transporter [Rhizophagus irregularis DAOM 181602=DAOM 197198]UZO17910.1 hypothetical protein OCT59_009242 [Rhizophagus irregularis]CAB5150118.1 unnamed protein product [Rhizophagus irregularis]CAG8666998.1 12901_t:CDS:2 [Rhizophagus irregularis]|eukprot:XP_025171165.1 putative ABC transporter [Rhizophagus irregularis DAOM 181602=DAOM 197198]
MPKDFYEKDGTEYAISLDSTDLDNKYSTTKEVFNSKVPVSLAWKNLTYEIVDPKTKKNKKIIQNVSGIVKPGEFLAIMGPLGAGKSTFLDMLAGRKDPKNVSGIVYLNGRPGDVKCVSTYVTQDDSLMGVLTVRENIKFAADLCFPASFSRLEKYAHVQNIIREFGLERVADNKIGTLFVRGINSGEKRRCAIASQVITLPKVIFLDEPTTGLDSAAAYNVMSAIVSMAKKHELTVVASIHQPSPETYALFDKLLLLGHGKTLYFGERDNALTYFEKLGFPCPPYNNPADHYLRLVNSDFMNDITEAEQRITSFSISFSKRNIRGVNKEIDDLIAKSGGHGEVILIKTRKEYARSLLAQTLILMKRSFKNATRNILMYWIRIAMYMCLALLMGSTWWKVGLEQKNIEDRFSAHFFSVTFLSLMSVAGIPGFLEERLVFQRERSIGFYSVGPYVLANTLISTPFLMIITLSFSIIAYPMIGLHENIYNAINFLAFIFLTLFVAESMVIFISAAIPTFVAALAITTFANGFYMVIAGYLVRRSALPEFLKWCHHIDYQKYSFEAIIQTDFVGLTFNCNDEPECKCIFGVNSTGTCELSGQDILDYYGYTKINLNEWALALMGLIVFFRFGFYLILRFRKGRRR